MAHLFSNNEIMFANVYVCLYKFMYFYVCLCIFSYLQIIALDVLKDEGFIQLTMITAMGLSMIA